MTFCLGMALDEGLVGIADTLITSGRECTHARKLSVYNVEGGSFFVMTSGLRSLRDKTLTYFEDVLEEREEPFRRLFHAVDLFADQLRLVREQDGAALEKAQLGFNLHALIGGQMQGDKTHRLYLLYPQGNWVETGPGTPYQMIGSTGYGKPVLDRALKHHDSMQHAFKVGCLSFDSTRISAADVDFPIDAVLYARGSFRMVQHRFDKGDLAQLSEWWQERMRGAVSSLPSEWMDDLFSKLELADPADEPADE